MESIAVLSSIIEPGESNAHNSRTLQLPVQIHNVLWMVQQSENWKKWRWEAKLYKDYYLSKKQSYFLCTCWFFFTKYYYLSKNKVIKRFLRNLLLLTLFFSKKASLNCHGWRTIRMEELIVLNLSCYLKINKR